MGFDNKRLVNLLNVTSVKMSDFYCYTKISCKKGILYLKDFFLVQVIQIDLVPVAKHAMFRETPISTILGVDLFTCLEFSIIRCDELW